MKIQERDTVSVSIDESTVDLDSGVIDDYAEVLQDFLRSREYIPPIGVKITAVGVPPPQSRSQAFDDYYPIGLEFTVTDVECAVDVVDSTCIYIVSLSYTGDPIQKGGE